MLMRKSVLHSNGYVDVRQFGSNSPHLARYKTPTLDGDRRTRAAGGDRSALVCAAPPATHRVAAATLDGIVDGARPDRWAGDSLNLGEVTVTRCALRWIAPSGPIVGIGHVVGRSHHHAEFTGMINEATQDPDTADENPDPDRFAIGMDDPPEPSTTVYVAVILPFGVNAVRRESLDRTLGVAAAGQIRGIAGSR